MNKESRKEYMRAYRARRKANGLCVRCGKPVDNGHCSCDECLEVARVKAVKRYRQRAIDSYKEVQDE